MRFLLAAFILHLSAFILSAQTVGQFELRKRTSSGFTSYGITPENGKAIGITAGVPAMITVGGSGSGTGDALIGDPLSQFAATTSQQLRGVLSDESGTGLFLTTTGSGASLTGITAGQISGLGTLATQSATITDYITSAAAAAAYQPLDSDLTSVAALATTAAGLALLDDADASAQRTTLGLGTLATQSGTITDYITTAAAAAAYQPLDSDLTSIAALATTTAGRSLLDDADASAQRTTLGLGTLATQSGTITDYITTAAAAAAYQPLDSDLTSVAALATTAAGLALLDDADAAAQRTTLGLGTLATQSGTFSGTSSGTNTGDQSLAAYLTSATAASTYQAQTLWLASLNTAAGAAPNAVLHTDGLVGFTTTETGAAGFALLTAADATALRTAVLPSKATNGGKFLRVNAGATDYELATISGGGDALTSGTLAQFAATTSTQLRSVISDESGSGDILTTNGSGAALTGITSGQVSGLGTLATQSATITDYITSAAAAAAYQPLDSDLTAIAALVTTTTGRALLDDADASAQRTTLGLGTLATQSGTITDYITTAAAAAAYQPLDSDLTSIAALITTTAGRALLDDADASAQRTTLGLAIGADVQAYSASTSLLGASIDLTAEITGTLPMANGGTGSALTDPNADRIAFWDDSAGVMTWLTAGTGLTITGTTITASGGGGGAPQPVQAVKTDTATITSESYVDVTGLSVAYTPTSVTQKVLVRGSVSVGSTSSNMSDFVLARGGTILTQGDTASARSRSHASFYDSANSTGMETATFEFLDTPGVTTQVTYTIQAKRVGGSGAAYINRTYDDGDYATRARTVSTLTIIPFAE